MKKHVIVLTDFERVAIVDALNAMQNPTQVFMWDENRRLAANRVLEQCKHPRQARSCEQLAADLTAEIDAAWFMIERGFDIEPRAEIEREAKTNGFNYGLAQAVHCMWKRNPVVKPLQDALSEIVTLADGAYLMWPTLRRRIHNIKIKAEAEVKKWML